MPRTSLVSGSLEIANIDAAYASSFISRASDGYREMLTGSPENQLLTAASLSLSVSEVLMPGNWLPAAGYWWLLVPLLFYARSKRA